MWPPPIGTWVTVRSVCCGRQTAEHQFKWDGDVHQFTGKLCPGGTCGQHEPLVSATWTTFAEAAS